MQKKRFQPALGALLVLLVSLMVAAPAFAGWVDLATFIGTSLPLDATAKFQRGDGTGGDLTNYLKVILTNTATNDPFSPPEILTAVFFNITNNGGPTNLVLGRQAAWIVAPNSITYGGGTDPGGVVGGEWAYAAGIAPVGGANRGIGSSGFGLFGPGDLFPGSNLAGPVSPDGVQYGVTTAFDTPGNDNGGLANNPTIKNEVNFKLSGLDQFGVIGFDHVSFQYGTALTDTNVPGNRPPVVPEPNTLYALTAGLVALGISAQRWRRKK